MPIIAKKSGGDFTPAPEGVHSGVCVDVADLGMQPGPYGSKHKVRLTWELEERMPDGKPYITSKFYNLSLHEKSGLHKDLKAWRGKPFTPEELKGFDVEKVLGAPVTLIIEHNEKDGSVYANITAVTKPTKRLAPSGKYVRYKDRAENQGKQTTPAQEEMMSFDEPDQASDPTADGEVDF